MHLGQKCRVKYPCGHQYSLATFQPICPTAHLQHNASPKPLQIQTAAIHRELPAIESSQGVAVKWLAMDSIKRLSHFRVFAFLRFWVFCVPTLWHFICSDPFCSGFFVCCSCFLFRWLLIPCIAPFSHSFKSINPHQEQQCLRSRSSAERREIIHAMDWASPGKQIDISFVDKNATIEAVRTDNLNRP
jgi:hypothetical protein